MVKLRINLALLLSRLWACLSARPLRGWNAPRNAKL